MFLIESDDPNSLIDLTTILEVGATMAERIDLDLADIAEAFGDDLCSVGEDCCPTLPEEDDFFRALFQDFHTIKKLEAIVDEFIEDCTNGVCDPDLMESA